ncbi:Uncharacterised protein [Vibrio cholerae]|uniref:Uncharacterized protein n=1 Tax=Vibrio cholerae TaxID=666 RepID=A0A655ZD12_VIBCL|nr:Uncharacterised protein [Vibrio cholerae]
MHSWAIGVKTTTITDFIIGKILLLGNEVNHVKSETIDTFFSPKSDDVFYFFSNLRIFPVQIGLLFGKQMQIILTGRFIQRPRTPAKFGLPVVRHTTVNRLTPNIVITVRAIAIAQCRLEPSVFG